MMRQEYQLLEIEVFKFQDEDVITASTVKEDIVWDENPWED